MQDNHKAIKKYGALLIISQHGSADTAADHELTAITAQGLVFNGSILGFHWSILTEFIIFKDGYFILNSFK